MSKSKKIEEELKVARKEVPKRLRKLLKTKVVITKKLRKAFRNLAAQAISTVVSRNASRMQQLSQNKVRAMKRELRLEQRRALEKAFRAFASSPDWMWYPRSFASSSDPLDDSGINQEGRLWKLLEEYATPLKDVFGKYGLTVPRFAFRTPWRFFFFCGDSDLKSANREVGEAHDAYARARLNVEILERELKQAGALEKFKSA